MQPNFGLLNMATSPCWPTRVIPGFILGRGVEDRLSDKDELSLLISRIIIDNADIE